MKNKFISWIGILSLLIICTIQAQAYTEVQYSEDNLTWIDLTTTSEREAFIDGLEADSKYFFRARTILCDANSTALPYIYTNGRTEAGGLDEMELAIIISLITFISLTAFAAFKFEKEIRCVFVLLTSLAITFLLNVLGNLALIDELGAPIGGDDGLIFFAYKISLYGFWALVLFCLTKMLMSLKPAKKAMDPRFESPLQRTKRLRKERQEQRRGSM